MYVYENICIPTIKSTNVTLSGNDVYITIPNISLLNGKKWYLIICQAIPKGANIGNVFFVRNGVNIPAMNGLGNALKTDMLRSRKRYTITYGWNTPHIMVCGTCPSAFIPPTAVTETPPAAK